MEEDYYKILEIDKNADDDDINKAYKRLSKIYHPDKNPNNKSESEENFKKINEAKNILLDKEKRKLYDDFGFEGLKGNVKQDFNPFDIFSNIFQNPFFNSQNFNTSQNFNSIQRQLFDEYLSLEQVYSGCSIHKKLKINKECSKCQGFGFDNIVSCNTCNGRGSVTRIQQIGPIITQSNSSCNSCDGKGKTGYGNCSECKGSKNISKLIEIDVKFPPNIVQGSAFVYKMDNIELIFKANLKQHELFKRNNYDLNYTHKITLRDALCGFSFKLKMLDGNNIVIKNTKIIKPNTSYTIKNLGFVKDDNSKGDLIINFDIEFPNLFTEEEINILDNLIKQDKQETSDINLKYYNL